MTINYECNINLNEYEEVTEESIAKAKAAIEKAGYDWYRDGDEISIGGDIEVDDYVYDAADIASEISWILWDVGGIDADADAEVA